MTAPGSVGWQPLNRQLRLPAGERYLLISDIHQNIAWAGRVLAKESGKFDRLILLGDYFDRRGDETVGARKMAGFLNDLMSKYTDRLTLLLGNHDIQYIEAALRAAASLQPEPLCTSIGGDYSPKREAKLRNLLGLDFWQRCQPLVRAGEWLISHAGVAACFWPELDDVDASIAAIAARFDAAVAALPKLHSFEEIDPLFAAGFVRGGLQAIGGILWQDFEDEFCDDLPLGQIVGHSSCREPGDPLKVRARRRGRSWCIDGRHTVYAVIESDGAVRIGCA